MGSRAVFWYASLHTTDFIDHIVVRPQAAAPPNQAFVPPANRPAGHIKTLEEIEAEMAGIDLQPPVPAQSAAPQHKIMSLEEIEAEMMSTPEPVPQPPQPQPLPQPQPQLQPPPALAQVREDSQTTVPLAGSGYASGQALLDSMFPQLGAGPGGPTGSLLPPDARPSQPSPDEMARLEALQKHIAAKIESMSRYNHLMGSSDKDFITRMQLSQLVTADPYASDFYAQVFSAVRRSQQAAEQAEAEARGVVNVGPNAGLGVSGPAGNRFGKMGSNTMTRLSTQVKRLVDSRAAHQKNANAGEFAAILPRSPLIKQMSSKALLAKSRGRALLPLDQCLLYPRAAVRTIDQSTLLTSKPA